MNRKWENMKKKYQDNGQLRQKIYIGCLLVAVCCLFAGILAKYVHESVTENSQITADKFYFTTNILGDTKMINTDGTEQMGYAFDAQSTEGTWSLYGSGQHDITIRVQNYFDNLRITEQEIAYEGSVTVQDADGKDITKASGGEFPELKIGTEIFSKGTLTPAESDKKAQTDMTLSIPAYTAWNYADGTVVTARIKSTSPYKKTLTMKFVLYAVDTTLKYRIVDSVGSPYAELILMTNADKSVQPWLKWPESLSIDNTNPLTYTYANGAFTQQAGMTDRNMQISQALKNGQSESIYFFKNNTSENYAKDETIVVPTSDTTSGTEKYVIEIGK